jgi:vWA-MoxR associated protein C-terminal domain/vWA-MoxR associated protein middle region (VMAP-M) 1/Trypsin-like peptidase domain
VRESSIVGIEGSDDKFVGCGFAVTPRHILTCAHVVDAALGRTGNDTKLWPSTELTLGFPFLKPYQSLKAKVVYWRPMTHDVKNLPSANLGVEEDIAGLELLDPLSDIEVVQWAAAIEQAQFKVFGYPKKTYQGAIAEGKIQGKLPMDWFQIEGTCPEGLWAAPGYSGTAVWEWQTGLVCYGMVVAAQDRDDGVRIAYMMPSQQLQPAIATLQLLDALSFPDAEPENLQKIYRDAYQRCCPPDWPPDRRHPGGLTEILSELSEMGDWTVSGMSVSRMVAFAAHLAIERTLPTAKLRQWGQTQFEAFGELVDQVQREQAAREQQRLVADPCLIFVVSDRHPLYNTETFFLPDAQRYDAKDPQTYERVLCWDAGANAETITNLPNCSWAELPDRLSGYFKTCAERNLRPARLEVLLPLSQMNQPIEPIEWWKLTHNPYDDAVMPGNEYQVVVRDAARADRDYQKHCGPLWETNWARLQQQLGAVSHPWMAKVSPLDKIAQLKAHYQSGSIVGFQLNGVPQKKFFEALLGAAAPVAVWLRQSPGLAASKLTGESGLHLLEDFLQCPVGQLPGQALMVRAQAIAVSENPEDCAFMIGHHLSLLWENPNLLPPLPTKTISESL